MTYDFSETMELLESKARHGGTQEALAAEAGITRVTLGRREKKARNDMDGYAERYGDVYIDMWVQGVDEVIDSPDRIHGRHYVADALRTPGEHLLVKAHLVPSLFATDWYSDVIKGLGTAGDRRRKQINESYEAAVAEFKAHTQ